MSENQKTNFRHINSVEGVDFSKIDTTRGQTPPDIKEKCLKLCQDYLCGNWCQQTVHTIEVRRITGGFINQLYYCGITQPYNEDTPQEVAIKLYGQNIFDLKENRIRDVVISLAFSQNNLGPKVYGLFEKGVIQKFYKHRQFKNDEQKNPELVKKVFKALARIHSLKVPLERDPFWLYNRVLRLYEVAFNKYPINKWIEEYNCQTLMKYDLKTEIDWFKGVIERLKSPVVFTHNDFRSSNLLITEPNDELIVCDYDLCSYGYRGNDFALLFKEWGHKQFEIRTFDRLPIQEDDVCKLLIEIYVDECQHIFGESYSQNPINSVQHILKEVKTFLLLISLNKTVFLLKMDEQDDDFWFNRKISMEFADKAFNSYFIIKEELMKQNIVN